MLAQSFLSAADLGLTEKHRDALIKTLVLFETNQMKYVSRDEYITRPFDDDDLDFNYKASPRQFSGEFNMAIWDAQHKCGTICCIGGTAELIGGVIFEARTDGLCNLFYCDWHSRINMWEVTAEQAARALRNYLTTGQPDWTAVCNLP